MQAKTDNHRLLFETELENMINLEHPLVKLAQQIGWATFEEQFGVLYDEGIGRPAKPIRLMVGLQYLKYTFNFSDEQLVYTWIENPYWQYFCGEKYFRHKLPIDPTSMTKWRNRVKDSGLETLLEETIKAGLEMKVIKKADTQKLVVDTTVQEKNITFPTDAKLCFKAREKLVDLASVLGIKLRQTYRRLAKQALVMQSRYAKSRKFGQAKKEQKKLKNFLGRVVRDIENKIGDDLFLRLEFSELLDIAKNIYTQTKNSKNKTYSIHEPDVQCIAKGKAHKKYEFGCKAGFVTTAKNCFVVGAMAFEGNPFDGHTLRKNLSQTKRFLGVEQLGDVYVDEGYKGHDCEDIADVTVVKRGWRKKKRSEKRWLKRRSSIEPTIGHLKQDNRLCRNYLKGIKGDKANAILSACGYNMRKLLRKFIFALIYWWQIMKDIAKFKIMHQLRTLTLPNLLASAES